MCVCVCDRMFIELDVFHVIIRVNFSVYRIGCVCVTIHVTGLPFANPVTCIVNAF